ncbi:MAG: ATP-dependent exonuclease SbcCD, C subunit-like protein, partial [Synergistaceae bacterium]|nr:ATP-dependent exonuclease SbcCD, C subunit-like protein [Synergistaceae bacterium]
MAPRQLELDLDMDTPVSSSGFRLRKFELYNWGTFHGRVWSLRLDGENGLLTGDIGSGKSTFMDAMTTLLIPPNRAAYNKAAGAETRERSLRSYVEGHYKSERLEDGMTARPVALRGPGSYSVLLGCFHNESLDYTTTLAQVFWMRENEPQPDRFYVVSHKDLSIKEHFSSFGADMKNLRARLKDAGADIFDSFHQYRSRFSRDIGIPGEQGEHALELFHQAVSIKAIGDLSDFVRGHMLEPFDTGEKIRELIKHYDDLLKAHNSILTSKNQIGLLEPIVANCEKHRELIADIASMTDCLAALEVYFARHKAGLSFRRIEALKIEEEKLSECLK